MDFIINTLLSKGHQGTGGNESTHPEGETGGTCVTFPAQTETVVKAIGCVSGTAARTCSVSVLSHELGSDGHAFPELG